MPRVTALFREEKIKNLAKKYYGAKFLALRKLHGLRRLSLLSFSEIEIVFSVFCYVFKKFQRLPKNSVFTRSKARCWRTGKARGHYAYFRLCRNAVKDLAGAGLIPGLTQATW
jgi:ribosomal protein S14